MTLFGSADNDVFLADMGVDVVYNGSTVKGIFSDDEIVVPQMDKTQLVVRARSVLVKTGALGVLSMDTAITVDSVGYTIRSFDREPPDGLFTRIVFAG